MALAPGRHPSRAYSTLRECAYSQRREMIVTGVLPPGAEREGGQVGSVPP